MREFPSSWLSPSARRPIHPAAGAGPSIFRVALSDASIQVNKKWDLRLPVFPADAQVVDIGPRPVSPSKEAGVMAAALMIGGGNRL
jgi:hypothetical protein